MSDRLEVAVIGGGIVGCSLLYHLADAGLRDVALFERSELAAGSSWHAAGSLFALTHPSCGRVLQKYAQQLYASMGSIGYHSTGGLSLASSAAELEALKVGRAAGLRDGVETELLSPAEAQEIAPILSTEGLLGALYEPSRGHVDPFSATRAFAGLAKARGASIYLRTPVVATRLQSNGDWVIATGEGEFHARRIVNAAGLWAREVARLAGIEIPLMPVEHQYIVTGEVPEIAEMGRWMPSISDSDAEYYSRQEGHGMLIGAYESPCRHWSREETPSDFGQELLANDLDRILPNLERAFARMPALADAQLRTVLNGPMIFSPDLEPLIGPHPALPNYYLACGVMTGFNQGPGIGRVLTEWIIDGEPGLDVLAWDAGRFGNWATPAYTEARTRYFYEHRHQHVYPYQEFDAGRPLHKVPVHGQLEADGAVFGFSFGHEHPLWFAAAGETTGQHRSYRRAPWHAAVRRECLTVAETAGLFEISTFAKFRLTGRDSVGWLKRIFANRMSLNVGKTTLSPMLSEQGRLIGDFTVSRLDENEYLLLGAGSMQAIHARWFRENEFSYDVSIENVSTPLAGLHIAGPRAREILASALDLDLGNDRLPFLGCMKHRIFGHELVVVRVSFTGEAGYELYCPAEAQAQLYEQLRRIGKSSGLGLSGSLALMSLRLEKAFPSWGSDLSPDFSVAESGLSRFVRNGGKFIGAGALASQPPPRYRRCLLVVDDTDIDPAGGEPVFADERPVGFVTSGGYGHRVDLSLGIAYVDAGLPADPANLEIELVGERYPARLHPGPVFDPTGQRMRA